jgi:hypothetical protein
LLLYKIVFITFEGGLVQLFDVCLEFCRRNENYFRPYSNDKSSGCRKEDTYQKTNIVIIIIIITFVVITVQTQSTSLRHIKLGAGNGAVIEALRYKQENRGIDSR